MMTTRKISPFRVLALGLGLAFGSGCGSRKAKDAAAPQPPATQPAPGPQRPVGPAEPGAATPSFAAVVLNKDLIAADGSVGQRTLTLQLGVSGGGVATKDVWFECKREGLSEFRRCPQGTAYEFSELKDGATYSLSVRALHRASGYASPETSVNFTAKPKRLKIRNLDALRGSSSASVTLGFDLQESQNTRVSCVIDRQEPVDCTSGYPVALSQLAPGSHKLYVEARDARNAVTGSEIVNFCVGACSAPVTQGTDDASVPLSPTTLLIGGSYDFRVPPDMHITEYATINTYNGALSFLRILDDRNYVGIYSCDQMFDRVVSLGNYQYCHSTPTQDLYKWMVDHRISFNHVEVATTNPEPKNHRRIMMNLFDQRGEYRQDRSRFDQLCAASRATVKASPLIPVAVDFWGEQVYSVVYTCQSYLPSGFGAVANRHEDYWWVGGVFITTERTSLPSADCFATDWRANGACASYRNPQMLEVVFMQQGLAFPEHEFVRVMQNVVRDTLSQVVPRE